MAPTQGVRLYVTFPTPAGGVPAFAGASGLHRLTERIIHELGLPASFVDAFPAKGFPTQQWKTAIDGLPPDTAVGTQVVQLEQTVPNKPMLDEFFQAAKGKNWGYGVDLAASAADFWWPMYRDPSFGTRREADAQIGAAALKKRPALTGAGVNVVIVDRGLDSTRMPPGSFNGGGWAYTPPMSMTAILPGSARGDDAEHGLMLVRNIHALAPDAIFYDLPLIPPAILNIPAFIASAQAAFQLMQTNIATMPPQPWVIVNAWALFDRRSDLPKGSGGFGDDGNHPFHAVVQQLAAGGSDVVFVAGNCGQYCPDDRCGPLDIGPGHSISGASAYPEVLTVGGVRVDGLRLGYASQGPGLIATQKPDVCAPANFSEVHDEGLISSGTSAACAVAAGVVAALRTKSAATPAAMITALKQGAGGASCDPQFGFGTINVGATRTILGV